MANIMLLVLAAMVASFAVVLLLFGGTGLIVWGLTLFVLALIADTSIPNTRH